MKAAMIVPMLNQHESQLISSNPDKWSHNLLASNKKVSLLYAYGIMIKEVNLTYMIVSAIIHANSSPTQRQ